MQSASNAILPLLWAERDRAFLKQVRRNRDEESKLMANVKGWKVWIYNQICNEDHLNRHLFICVLDWNMVR